MCSTSIGLTLHSSLPEGRLLMGLPHCQAMLCSCSIQEVVLSHWLLSSGSCRVWQSILMTRRVLSEEERCGRGLPGWIIGGIVTLIKMPSSPSSAIRHGSLLTEVHTISEVDDVSLFSLFTFWTINCFLTLQILSIADPQDLSWDTSELYLFSLYDEALHTDLETCLETWYLGGTVPRFVL